jgi:hypothetical protein
MILKVFDNLLCFARIFINANFLIRLFTLEIPQTISLIVSNLKIVAL